jgi:Ca-activated chloride channel homolog
MRQITVFSFFFILLTILAGGPCFAEQINITQVDTSALLVRQEVDLYLNISDEAGRTVSGIDPDRFMVRETGIPPESSPRRFQTLPILSVKENPHKEKGIMIMLLVDNSGSMYDSYSGEATEDPARMRTTGAREAIRSFTGSSIHGKDRVGLASFNTNLTIHAEEVKDPAAVNTLLGEIKQPGRDDAYTELYHSLIDVARRLGRESGRRAVVVLSDGENYPWFEHRGEEHPLYGTALPNHQEVLSVYQEEGITLYAINYAGGKDQHLGDIAIDSGGIVYDARNSEELSTIYRDIREKIEQEYQIRYRAGLFPSEQSWVEAILLDSPGGSPEEVKSRAERFYHTSTIFGLPSDPYPWIILLALPLAIALWFLLLAIRYRKRNSTAALQLLQSSYGTRVSSATVPLSGGKTVIGSSTQADLTIAGRGAPQEEAMTIVYNKDKDRYIIESAGTIVVNNRESRSGRELSPGDVINLEGTTIVFEEPDQNKSSASKKPSS